MQLSVPLPASPAPSSTCATGGNLGLAGDSGNAANTDTAADSFESLLSDSPDGEPSKDEAAPDAVVTSDLLAAALWLPLAPLAPAVPATAEELDLALAADGEAMATPTSETPVEGASAPATEGESTLTAGPTTPYCAAPRVARRVGLETKSLAGQDHRQGRALGLERTPSGLPRVAAAAALAAAPARPLSALAAATPAVVPSVEAAVPEATGVPLSDEALAGESAASNVTADALVPDLAAALDNAAGKGAEATVGESSNLLMPTGLRGRNVGGPGLKLGLREKIAAGVDGSETVGRVAKNVREKYFLESGSKGLATVEEPVGIAVAKPELAMPATSNRPHSAPLVEAVTSVGLNTSAVGTGTITLDAPAPVAAVRQAVAAVINAVETLERRADVQQKTVDLNFKVGSENLGLRVELREGTVHTTFRTESAEMTGAITREWNSVVHPALGATFRIAEPVFSSSTNGNGDSSAGHFGSHPHQQHGEKPTPNLASAFSQEFYDTGATEAVPVAVVPAANSSQLLNALA